MDEQLKELRSMENEASVLAGKIAEARTNIKNAFIVSGYNDIELNGVRVYWKAGRKKVDRIGAFEKRLDGATVDEQENLLVHLANFTTTPPDSVAWAKVTKAAGIDTAPFTTQADPVLTIEVK